MAYTEQEERFIEASIAVVQCGEEKRLAAEAFNAASKASAAVAHETLGERRSDIDYVCDLTLEAARRAGFGDDSEVVQVIRDSAADVKAYVALVDRLHTEVLVDETDVSEAL